MLAAVEADLGVSISLLFVRGPSVEETLDAVALAMTADRSSMPLVKRGAFALASLPSGFHMIWSNTCDERRFTEAVRATLAQNGEVVLQSVEEHVMFSHVEFWSGGAQQWRVSHQGDEDDKDLTFEGKPPALFDTLREEATARGDDGDFFDIAVGLGEQLTGFRYDRGYDWMDESAFTSLVSTAAGRPFWKFW
jgi:hypothetical protein